MSFMSKPSSPLFDWTPKNAESISALSMFGKMRMIRLKGLCIKWTRFFNLDYLNENMKDLSLKHSVQDVLPPFAMLAKINLEIADL